jgi:replication fork clamp-binding protein CrfC
MSDDIAELIWEALGNDRVTTGEASRRLEEALNYRCPDDLAKTLSKMRKAGLVKGEIDLEAGGWMWWADEECRKNRSQEGR